MTFASKDGIWFICSTKLFCSGCREQMSHVGFHPFGVDPGRSHLCIPLLLHFG
ncbi:hypothetical protein PAXRUDRAFT_791249 [Paxillus rubicundulus Ve08.2h10]|uniref:Uncharacterized protein n=1 Tax=Paxillus rubicundulus Ve08.2h10 TaxID=930991 RepID=A0A0D0DMG6_9AGAM|nr:hypothetical protein PAXRUDRAFT_791249 [Paxillus rubicundulus Ve08.2h10]